MHVARDMGRLFFSRVAGTPDNAPASSRVVGVPAEWRALSEYTLNEGQEQTMAALAMGGNVLSRQPTGSGKSYTYLLPAIAQWAAMARARARCADERTRDRLPLPPICIVVAPFRALCGVPGVPLPRRPVRSGAVADSQRARPAIVRTRTLR